MTDIDLNKEIQAIAATISRQPLGLVYHRPEDWGQPTRCFENVRHKVGQDGGEARFGWMFHSRRVADIDGPGYVIAAHHAVWHAPDGHLIDVTPFHADPKHHPLGMPGSILFLVDDAATPVVAGVLVGPRPSRFFALTDDPRLLAHVERLKQDEERQCREIYAGWPAAGRGKMSMAPILRSHEGKACDAILRRIERREGAQRQKLRFPEAEHHSAPIELTCEIGARLFAFEHTGIEPFAGHLRLEAEAITHFKPIESMLAGALPPNEHIELHIPLKATQGLKGASIRRIHEALVPWIIATAPTLPIARYGRYVTPIQSISVPGVPFPVSLHRTTTEGFPARFSIRHLVTGDAEAQRLARVREACERKFPKLAAWKRDQGARTVLVLEENDIQLTNAQVVADALLEVETTIPDKPDEVFLVSTAIDNPWWSWALRIDARDYYAFSQAQDCLCEVDPATLTNITGR